MAGDEALEAIDQATLELELSPCGGPPTKVCGRILTAIDHAHKEMTKAREKLDHTRKDGTPDPKYDKAIGHYRKAWRHAQKAMRNLSDLMEGL